MKCLGVYFLLSCINCLAVCSLARFFDLSVLLAALFDYMFPFRVLYSLVAVLLVGAESIGIWCGRRNGRRRESNLRLNISLPTPLLQMQLYIGTGGSLSHHRILTKHQSSHAIVSVPLIFAPCTVSVLLIPVRVPHVVPSTSTIMLHSRDAREWSCSVPFLSAALWLMWLFGPWGVPSPCPAMLFQMSQEAAGGKD